MTRIFFHVDGFHVDEAFMSRGKIVMGAVSGDRKP